METPGIQCCFSDLGLVVYSDNTARRLEEIIWGGSRDGFFGRHCGRVILNYIDVLHHLRWDGAIQINKEMQPHLSLRHLLESFSL